MLYRVNIFFFTSNWRITKCVVLLSVLNGIRKNSASKYVFKCKQEFTLWFKNLVIKLVVKRGYFWLGGGRGGERKHHPNALDKLT